VSAVASLRGVVLCEDKLTERFLRRLLGSFGFDTQRRILFEPAPSGLGAAEAWVRERYPREVALLRSKRHQRDLCLLAARDGDNVGVEARKRELDAQLVANGLEPRLPGERIALPVPTWSIETWLLALLGDDGVREDAPLKEHFQRRHRGHVHEAIGSAVKAWNEGTAAASSLPSLRDGVSELARLSW